MRNQWTDIRLTHNWKIAVIYVLFARVDDHNIGIVGVEDGLNGALTVEGLLEVVGVGQLY